ncbi:NADPH-dependent glutamate synthase [Candidatus Bathyarchaeota archaeon]|nr:NADPH-dependent glutamate synthase [Candidatus Bathyarchaeota archaeon]
MPKQAPKVRRENFEEVATGYTEQQALEEASRCLQCPKPLCVTGCPVGICIPDFVKLLREGKYDEAIQKIKEKNALPAVCGRVCPQEEQCQKMCILGKVAEPVSIGRLERWLADWERKKGIKAPARAVPTGKKVAVIGAGPAGLTVAAELAKLGHKVVMYEALHLPGGVLVYGIPEFRLPKSIVQSEVDYVQKLGADLNLGYLIGRIHTIPELLKHRGFDAVFIGTGAGLPAFMGVPGEGLGGVYSASEFLIRVNLMKSYAFPIYDTPIRVGKHVVVIGGGNVAMDSARSALRLGAEVCIVYRRSREEMPARKEEIENAEEEGILCKFLANPIRFVGDEKGWVKAMECVCMELGPPDESGRRRPVPVKGSEFVMDADTVIVAVGRSPNPIIQSTTEGLAVTKWGTIMADDNGKTNIEGVYAGGDIVTGEATVISAMGAGKKAAKAIHEYLITRES